MTKRVAGSVHPVLPVGDEELHEAVGSAASPDSSADETISENPGRHRPVREDPNWAPLTLRIGP